MSASATPHHHPRSPPTHLLLFLDLPSLDSLPPPPSTPPLLAPLYTLHRTLPTPVSLYSYLHALTLHLTTEGAITQSFSPQSISAGLLRFTDHFSARLLSCHLRHRSLSAFLDPLVSFLPFASAAAVGPVAAEWVDDFAVFYTASLVSHALRVAVSDETSASEASQSTVPSPASVLLNSRASADVSAAVQAWLSAVQGISSLPSAAARDAQSNLPFVSRLLLAPLQSLLVSSTQGPQDGRRWLSSVCVLVAEAFLDACGLQVSGERTATCPTAFQHCVHTVAQQWVFFLCTPLPLLPPSSPFPSPQAFAALVTPLTKAIPAHDVLALLHDLVVMHFGEISTFPPSYLTLPALPSTAPIPPSAPPTATSQRFHAVLTAGGVPVTSLLERLLLHTPSPQSLDESHRIRLTVAFLSAMVASGVSSMYSSALRDFLFNLMSSASPLSVPLLSAISAVLRSPQLPLLKPTVNACRQWKERLRVQEVQPSSIDGQLLELVVQMARAHVTISGMLGVTPSNSPLPPPPLTTFTRYPAAETWLAVVSFYSANPSHCLHSLARFCHTSIHHRREWEDFIRSSLNPALFQTFLLSSTSEGTSSPSSSSSPSSFSSALSTAPYHSLTLFLTCWVQRGLPGSRLIASSLEPLPPSLSSLLTPSSSSSYVASSELRELLSSYLHLTPRLGTSRTPLNSFAPADLSALLTAVLTYVAALSSPFASCVTVICAVAASKLKSALSPAVVAVAVNRWLKRSLVELSSADEAVRRSAGKGFVLALLLCEELQVDADRVWDAELSDCFLTQLTQHCHSMQRRTRHADHRLPLPSPALPPLVSLMDHLLSSAPLTRHWLSQVVRSSWASPTPWLLHSRQVVQLLTATLLCPAESPLSVLGSVGAAASAEWIDRVKGWTERVRDLQQTAVEDVDCICEDADLIVAADEPLLLQQAMDDDMQVEPALSTTKATPRGKPANGRQLTQPPSRKSGRFSRLHPATAVTAAESARVPPVSRDAVGLNRRQTRARRNGEVKEPLLPLSNGVHQHSHPLVPQMTAASAGESERPHTSEVSEAASVARPPLDDVAAFLASDASRSCAPRCPHALDAPTSTGSCGSPVLPPLRRWLRWVLMRSFIAPAPVESCQAFIASSYRQMPIHCLLTDCLRVTVQLVHRRRQADLCPFLTPDAPPLMDRLLSAALLPGMQLITSQWLLQTLVDLLSTADVPHAAVEDVLRAVPRLQDAVLPPGAALPAALLRRIFPLVVSRSFLVVWLLQCAALFWEHAFNAVRASLMSLLHSSAASLGWPAHRRAVRAALGERHPTFMAELERGEGEGSAIDAGDSSNEVAMVDEDELAVREEKQSASLATLVGAKWVEVDWARVCDDDLNLALLHRVERDRKAVKRSALPTATAQPSESTPSVSNDGLQRPRSPLEVGQHEAQTQTESAVSLSASPAHATSTTAEGADVVDLAALLLPSFDLPTPSPALSTAGVPVPISHEAERSEEVWDLFSLPDPLPSELTGFVVSSPMQRLPPPSSLPRPRPPSMLPPTPARSMAFTPMPRPIPPPTPPSPPRPASSRPSYSSTPLRFPPSSPSSAASGPFAHLKSDSISVKRSAPVMPPVVDVAAQLEPPLYFTHDTPPWLKGRALQAREDDDIVKRRRLL